MTDYGYQGENIVFIVGSPRSGTTWLQRLLACHPKVHTGQESDIFDTYIGPQLRAWRRDLDPKNSGRSAIGLGCYFREDDFLLLLRQYMLRLLEPLIGNLQLDEIFVEKTPSHALFIPEIVEMLPESRIVHVLRDARDVVASLLAASKSWGANWAPKTAKAAAQMWTNHVQAVRRTTRNLSKKQFYEVRYEDLNLQPTNVLRDVVCQFLKLEWNEEGIVWAIERNKPDIGKKTEGGTKIRVGGEFSKISGSIVKEPYGFVRKARPGSWKEDLSWGKKFCVWLRARKTMDEVGYQWTFPW